MPGTSVSHPPALSFIHSFNLPIHSFIHLFIHRPAHPPPTSQQDLERADGKGRAVDLIWTPGWKGVTPGFVAPMEIEGFDIYKMPPVTKAEVGRWVL